LEEVGQPVLAELLAQFAREHAPAKLQPRARR
jgi:hypothetical protein